MKASLTSNPAFLALNLRLVDDPKNADAILVIRRAAVGEKKNGCDDHYGNP